MGNSPRYARLARRDALHGENRRISTVPRLKKVIGGASVGVYTDFYWYGNKLVYGSQFLPVDTDYAGGVPGYQSGHPETASRIRGQGAVLLTDTDQVLYAGYLIETTSGLALDVYRWDPETDLTWTALWNTGVTPASVLHTGGGDPLDSTGAVAGTTEYIAYPQVAGIVFQGEWYFVVGDNGSGTVAHSGQLYIYAAGRTHTPSLASTRPVVVQRACWLDGGLAIAAAASSRVVVAVGIQTNRGRYSVVTQAADSPVGFVENVDTASSGGEGSGQGAESGSGDSGVTGFTMLDDWNPLPMPTAIHLRRTSGYDVTHLWVTDEDGLWHSTDGGMQWEWQHTPFGVDVDMQPIRGVGMAGTTVYACGGMGTVIKSTDAGVTWTVCTSSLRPEGEWTWLGDPTSGVFGTDTCTALTVIDAQHVVVVTAGGVIGYSANGGSTWVNLMANWTSGLTRYLRPVMTSGGPANALQMAYPLFTDCLIFDTALFVCGWFRMYTSSAPGGVVYRMLRLQNYANPTSTDFSFEDPVTISPAVDKFGRNTLALTSSGARLYTGGPSGKVKYRTTASATWNDCSLTEEAIDVRGLDITQGASVQDDVVYACGVRTGSPIGTDPTQNGRVFRANLSAYVAGNAQTAIWEIATLGEIPEAESVLIRGDEDILVFGRGGGRRQIGGNDERCYPALAALPDGTFLLACANLTQGMIEVWQADHQGDQWRPVPLDRHITWSVTAADRRAETPPKDVLLENVTTRVARSDVPRPVFVVEANATGSKVWLLAGDCARATVSVDGGTTWKWARDVALDIPVGSVLYQEIVGGSVTALNQTLSATMAHQGVIMITFRTITAYATRPDIAPMASRLWRLTSGGQYVPLMNEQPMPLGIGQSANGPVRMAGGLTISFLGTPAIGDQWTIDTRYRFRKEQVVEESPSLYVRTTGGPAGTQSTQEQLDVWLDWDRKHADVTAVLGAGWAWDVTAVALFGINIPYATLLRSKATATSDNEDPADNQFPDADYGTYSLSAVVASGSNGAVVGTPASGYNVYRTTQRWVPSQFKPGTRQYYLGLGTHAQVFKILDNTVTDLIVDTTADDLAGASATYIIFGDRMCLDLGLLASDHRYGRWIRLILPGLWPTAEGYRKLGTVALGVHVPLTIEDYDLGSGTRARDRYSAGYRWQQSVPTYEQVGPSGVRAAEAIGRPAQRWTLGYDRLRWFDRDSVMNPLLPQMQRAFALAFDGTSTTTQTATVEWVRLATPPELANNFADRFSWSVELIECI